MKTINDYSYNSKFKNINPCIKLIFGIIPIIMVLCFNSITVSIFVLAVMFLVTVVGGNILTKSYFKLLLIPFVFLITAVIPVIFDIGYYQDDVLFCIKAGTVIIYCTDENLINGIMIFLRAITSVSCMYFITLNTSMTDLIYAFKKMKLPSLVISLMELIYRYNFVLFEEYSKIHIAQRSRLGYRSFKTSVVSTGKLIASLFLKTYDKCDRVYNALESRGYTGEIPMLDRNYEKNLLFNFSVVLFPVLITVVFLIEMRWMH